jgi:hypothetical protein
MIVVRLRRSEPAERRHDHGLAVIMSQLRRRHVDAL